ncbi:MAG: ABC transporter permease [Bacteroidales bacterium]|nr:ABC transporter permease [Bacteroidales bacterium]
MTCSIALFLYVLSEYSFDDFHLDKHEIFRVIERVTNPDKTETSPNLRAPVGVDLKANFTEIKDVVRFCFSYSGMMINESAKVSSGKTLYADENFFTFFSFKTIEGDPEKILSDRNSIVLTQKIAEKLFGKKDPFGKTLKIKNQEYTVTGIVENPPLNSSIKFDVVFPLKPLIDSNPYVSWDGGMSVQTFIKIDPEATQQFESKLPDFLWKMINANGIRVVFSRNCFFSPSKKFTFTQQQIGITWK